MIRFTFRPGRRVGATVAVAATAVILAACGSGANHIGTSTQSASSTASGSPAPTQGTESAVLTTIDGRTVRVPSGKPSVLVFISISCADCSAAAKAVAQASHTVGDKAEFLAVDLDPGVPATDLTSFLDYVDAKGLPTMIDAKATLLAKYNVSALSSVIVIDSAGKVTYRAINPSSNAIVAAVSGAT